MTVTQRRHALGNFDITLTDVPADILQRLTFDKANPANLGAATVVITPARVDAAALGNSDTGTSHHPLFDLAVYTGVLTDITGQRNNLSGYGFAWHLGNHEDGGRVFPGNGLPNASNNARWIELDTEDWFDWLTNGGSRNSEDGSGPAIALSASQLYDHDASYSSAPAQDPVPYFPDFLTRREILTRICDYVGWIWYVDPATVIHAGEQSDLFPSPRAVIAAGLDSDPGWWTISAPADGIDWDESMDGYANKVAAFDSSTSPYATTFAYPNNTAGTLSEDFYGPNGDAIISVARDDSANQENVFSWGARVQQTQPLREILTRRITIEGTVHDHGVHLIPGEPVYVYEPTVGLVDTANQIHVAGRVIHPVSVDLHAVTWPILNGMGVYVVYYDQTAAELAHIDLSDVVVFEDGTTTTLEVGAPGVAL